MSIKFNQKGQSALEYLMTYGWALVVIVIVIAALVFLIQPSQVGGNTCSATSGILVTNHQVSAADSNITLALSNQTASTLSNVDVNVTGTIGGVTTTGGGADQITTLGTVAQQAGIGLAPAFNAGDTYSLQIAFGYSDRDGFARTVTATCNGTAS
ncbi:MAG TPA: hypothetical protein VFF13_05615 [archaeon]|nr:hypothetical protein [archaeon]